MIKKLQRRFIRIALAVLTAAILLAAVTINLANWVALRGEIASEAETLLTEGHGQNRRNGGNGRSRKPREADFEARYFLVTTEAGDLTADLSHVSSYTQETALQVGRRILQDDRASGFLEDCFFLKRNGRVLVLNCESRLDRVRRLAFISVGVCLVSILAAWALVSVFSRRAIQPILENEEKQKRFITDAGHELKTPLSVISANMDILALDDPDNEWIRSTRSQLGRLRRMIADMVFLAKADELAGSRPDTTVDLTALVNEMAEAFRAGAAVKAQTLRVEAEEGLTLRGSEQELSRLASVLCDNAVKYAPAGDEIVLRVYTRKKTAVIETENTCAGPLSQEKLGRLFDRFYRADEARTSDGSSGIGLAIARAAAERHGGSTAAFLNGDRLTIRCTVAK